MRKSAVLLAVPLLLMVGCNSAADSSREAPSSSTADGAADPTTSAAPTTLEITTATAPATAESGDPTTASGSILMVKLSVGDIAQGEQFYGTVFGAKLAMSMGESVHIVTFPDGGPGLVLLAGDAGDPSRKGSFIIRVADLEATQALAVANGATVQKAFAGDPGGQAARSVDLLDPWDNQVEILQIG